jgi:hypothetical protein
MGLPSIASRAYVPGRTCEDREMGDVVNLRLHRKRRDRTARETEAAANRATFGRSKADKELKRAADDLEARRLDGHRLPEDSETRTP